MFGFSLTNLFIGLGMAVAGVAMVKFTFQLVNMTGAQGWLERYTGSGSTYGVYKIFGVVLAIVGLMVASGLGTNVMEFFFSPLKHLFKPLS